MSWIQTAKVGDKVMCVNAWEAPTLREGDVYTIAAFRSEAAPSVYLDGISEIGVLLVEAKPRKGCTDFDVRRFRPVDTRNTDISIFTEMLKPIKAPQHEDA